MTTIIIPTVIGNEQYLDRCISSICQTSKELMNIIVIKNDWIGFAKAVNEGILKTINDKGEADDIILLNDDVILKKRWWDILQKKLPEADIIGDFDMLKQDHIPFYFVYIKKEVINQIGLLDERFEVGECEDVDFCIRAIESGFKIGQVDEPVCLHAVHGTLGRLRPEQEIQRNKNQERFRDKWKGTKYENTLK